MIPTLVLRGFGMRPIPNLTRCHLERRPWGCGCEVVRLGGIHPEVMNVCVVLPESQLLLVGFLRVAPNHAQNGGMVREVSKILPNPYMGNM